MHGVKRIEIVIGTTHERDVVRALESIGVPGLTVFEVVSGRGDRGTRAGGELSDAHSLRLLLTTCRPDQLDKLSAALEPLLRRFGGLCLLSDASVIRDEA